MPERTYPWFPSDAPHLDKSYEKKYVRDAQGTIWLVVRDDGMVTTADYSGQVWSGGIKWLTDEHGPIEYL